MVACEIFIFRVYVLEAWGLVLEGITIGVIRGTSIPVLGEGVTPKGLVGRPRGQESNPDLPVESMCLAC